MTAAPNKVYPRNGYNWNRDRRLGLLLCALGFHRWWYRAVGAVERDFALRDTQRDCRRCPATQSRLNIYTDWRNPG